MARITLRALRWQALTGSLFRPTALRRAIQKLGFVQADPIRSPARAQDLILRHRVRNYTAGDLEKHFPSLGVEEDFLYAYGFMPQSTWRLLHPRMDDELTAKEQEVLDIVKAHTRVHPRELEAYLGKRREVNAWGGYSKATTRILQHLHYRGLLRVAARENGIRIYEPVPNRSTHHVDPEERLQKLVLLVAGILAPLPERSLRSALQLLAHGAPRLKGRHTMVTSLIESGDLASVEVDEIRYVWPTGKIARKEPDNTVRFLAPFDPLVWDRRRFEHFWGWPYRFEAYTPPAKRKLGYYAMPLLWRDDVVGWVNITNRDGTLRVEKGLAKEVRNGLAFHKEFEAEVGRFRSFLKIEQ